MDTSVCASRGLLLASDIASEGSEASEGGHKDAEDARAEDAGSAVIAGMIEAVVEVLEQPAERQRHKQKDEPKAADSQEYSKRRKLRHPIRQEVPR